MKIRLIGKMIAKDKNEFVICLLFVNTSYGARMHKTVKRINLVKKANLLTTITASSDNNSLSYLE
jgi:hypothetical protein